MIEARGGRVLRLPALEIEPLAGSPGLDAALAALPESRLAVFVSANAVTHGLAAVNQRLGRFPGAVAVAAVGRATAAALSAAGVPAGIVPAGRGDSEALLAHPALADVGGATVVIFSGTGGRGLLARTLRERGAHVLSAECYRRVPAADDPSSIVSRWSKGEIDIAVITSVDSLNALRERLGEAGRRLLAATPAVVMSERVAAAARGTVAQALVAGDTSDAGIVEAIARWRRAAARRG
jgi:uroporphyrinogen-III synthase